uniref:Genome polyprotein n=1 Tax=Podosphaera prunicola tobamo-like virus TaxID=2052571 RepID=A0A2P9JAN1_9VIRU|nr:movement protein [Podosphaera prunicola tobamo-like virus]
MAFPYRHDPFNFYLDRSLYTYLHSTDPKEQTHFVIAGYAFSISPHKKRKLFANKEHIIVSVKNFIDSFNKYMDRMIETKSVYLTHSRKLAQSGHYDQNSPFHYPGSYDRKGLLKESYVQGRPLLLFAERANTADDKNFKAELLHKSELLKHRETYEQIPFEDLEEDSDAFEKGEKRRSTSQEKTRGASISGVKASVELPLRRRTASGKDFDTNASIDNDVIEPLQTIKQPVSLKARRESAANADRLGSASSRKSFNIQEEPKKFSDTFQDFNKERSKTKEHNAGSRSADYSRTEFGNRASSYSQRQSDLGESLADIKNARHMSYSDFGSKAADDYKTYVPPPADFLKKLATETSQLEIPSSIPSRYRIGNFNLSQHMRSKNFSETHVPVSRGDYDKVRTKIVNSAKGGFVITGPTGCGKSTVALLPLFANVDSTALIVEPTQANASNILHEFTNILPNLVLNKIIKGVVPKASFIAPAISAPVSRFSITTTEKLLEYFYFNGRLPKSDYIIIDEFHLPIPSMVEVVELIRTFDLCKKYILVSATAIGFKINAQLPPAVTQIKGNIPIGKLPVNLTGTDLDPRRWFHQGDGTIAIVAPSVNVARKLFEIYKDWKLRVFLITRFTTVSVYAKACSNYLPYSVYVLEPGVEAGVTLSISVLISMGCSTAVRYDGKVVLEDTQPLDEIAAIQRGGRGGRIKPTLYVSPVVPKSETRSSTSDYYRAQAVIKMIALGADLRKINFKGLDNQFPKLKTVTKSLAAQAVASRSDPFIAVYKTDASGKVYRECGGDGTGFSDLAKNELFLYHYPGGFYIAPISDFTDPLTKPNTFVLRNSQFTAAKAIVDSIAGLSAKYDLNNLVDILISKFDVYVADLFLRLKEIFSSDVATPFSISKSRPAEIEDFVKSSPPVLNLFAYLKTSPSGVVYDRVLSSPTQAKHSFSYKGEFLHFSFSSEYMKGSEVDVNKLSRSIFVLLQGLLAVEILLDGASHKCVDLVQYKGKISDEHIWFREISQDWS